MSEGYGNTTVRRQIAWRIILVIGIIVGLRTAAPAAIAKVKAPNPALSQIAISLAPGEDIGTFDATHGTSTLGSLPDGHTYIVNVPVSQTVSSTVAQWSTDPTVISAEPNYVVSLLAAEQFYLAFDQTSLTFLGSTFPVTATTQWAFSTIETQSANTISAGQGITVAVLDTGVDTSHPTLAAHLTTGGYDFVSHSPVISDVVGGVASGHGTFVAGLIAQMAPDAKILPFRVLDSAGNGTVANVAAAIELATNDGSRVINLSMGMTTWSATLQAAVAYAQAHGALIVASSGNRSTNTPDFPAAFPGVLSVTGTNQRDQRAQFSNFGDWVALSAPGVNLYSTYPGGYAYGSGTSFAAPLVAATAALVMAANPTLTASGAGLAVAQGSVDIYDMNPAFDGLLGQGRVDARRALYVATGH